MTITNKLVNETAQSSNPIAKKVNIIYNIKAKLNLLGFSLVNVWNVTVGGTLYPPA